MPIETDICVLGGGPAGAALAARLAQFGLRVGLVERAAFPRRRPGESLTPGVPPLLASLGAGPALAAAAFPRARQVRVLWEEARQRLDPAGQGLLVDRGRFDQLLLDHARNCGTQVWQPATVASLDRRADGWKLVVQVGGGTFELETRFVADATGRAGMLPRARHATGPRTLALFAYWRGHEVPSQPVIEAGPAAWFWGVPLPEGLYNTLVFVDPEDLRATRGSLSERFHTLLAESALLRPLTRASQATPVQAADATPYWDERCVTADSIKVGDAALALDPLSSSGVQRAIQSALAGAVVVNTLLQRPRARALAERFYRDHLREAAERHQEWTRGHYARVAARRPARFWRERAGGAQPTAAAPARAVVPPRPEARLRLAPGVEVVETPCVVDRFVEARPAVRHPALASPVAFLGGLELAPLLRELRAGLTLPEIARAWRPRVAMGEALTIARWLVERGLLVAAEDAPIAARGGAA